MKIQKKAKYDYESNGITEENGYKKWFDWEKTSKPVRFIGIAITVLIFVMGRIFKDELQVYGKPSIVIVTLSALAVLLVIVVPIHEIIHLLVMSKGKLDDKCVLTAGGGAVSAIYNGHISRNRQIVCFILPCAVFALIFTSAVVFSHGLLKIFFIYLLVMSLISSYTDIYMTVYTFKHVEKNEEVFGIYKRKIIRSSNLSCDYSSRDGQ